MSVDLLIVTKVAKMNAKSNKSKTNRHERLPPPIERNKDRKPIECLTKNSKTDQNKWRPSWITSRLKSTNKRRLLIVLLLIAIVNLAFDACQTKTRTDTFSAPITCHASLVQPEANQQVPISKRSSNPSQLQDGHELAQKGANPPPPATNTRHKRQVAQVTKQGSSSASSPAKAGPDVTRAVAVSGQTIEFQCPLTSELLATGHANSPTKTVDQNDHQEQQQLQLHNHQASRIIWRKDGQPLSQMNSTRLRLSEQQNSSSLTILQAQPKLDEATYECALQNGASPGTASLNGAPAKVHQFQLSLLVPPRLAPFEFPADAQVGMKVLLTCSALEGQQPISFVWLRDNQIIDSSSSVGLSEQNSGATNSNGGQRKQQIASLAQLHQQQLADKFALSAHSTVSMGDKSEYVLIGSPAAGNKPGASRPQHYNNNNDNSDENELDEMATPPSQQLQRNLPGKPKSTMHLADSSIRIRQADDYSILSIEPLELKHSGRYTCSAQNEAARVSHSSQLIINAPPTLTVEPKDGDLVSGHSIVIDCAASGQPRPTLSWLRARESNGGKQWDFVPIYENLRYTILSNGSLAINNVTQREQGFYMCSAKNGFGPEVTKLIKITVHEPARISSKYKLVEARVEEQAQINCDAEGEQPLSLMWLDKDGKQIDKNDKRFIIDDSQPADAARKSVPAYKTSSAQQQTNNQANISSVASSLIITRAARPDSGHYTCQASNKHGQDKMVVNLLVQDVPDKVSDLKVTNATASTISLRWQLGFTGNSPVTSYLIQYQSDDPLDDLLMSVAKNNQASTSGQLSTLTSDAMAHATTTQATSIGSDLSPSRLYNHLFGFLSDKDQEKQQQQQQQQQQASSLKAALETLNSLSSSLSDLSITSADEAIDRTLVELTVEQTATSLMIKDLSPFCVYRLRLAGINKIGLGEFSDWIRAKTEEAPPSGSALKITAAATGPNSIKLTWFPPDRRTWNGQLVRFQIGYRPIDSTYEFNKSVEWTPPTLMQSIMLDVDNKKRFDQRLDLKQADKFGQTLTDRQPDAMSLQSQSTNLTSSLSNSKDTQKSKNGLANGSSPYALKQHLRQLLAMQQQELVAHLTNLQRSTTYLVWIQAINGRGIGPQSHAISVKTLDDVPPSAPALRIQSTSTSSITIAWSMLSNFISPANQYSLFYRRVPPPSSATSHLQAIGRQQQFYPSRQQTNAAHMNNASLAQNGDNLAAIFSEPGPFIERTITSQQLMHAINQQTSGASNVFQLDEGSDLSQQQNIAKQFHTAFQAHHQQQQMHQQHYQQFVYTLDQLECGSIYELYMTTRNSVGKSEPSAVVTTRTLGEPPLAPHNKNSLFVRIGAQDVLLNLASWSTGGCPLTHVNVRYKQMPEPISAASSSEPNSSAPSSQTGSMAKVHPSFSVVWPVSTSVPNNLIHAINQQQISSAQMRIFAPSQAPSISTGSSQAHLISGSESPSIINGDQQQNNAQFALKSLLPSTGYELEIVAHNAAGHTTAQYEFVTAGPNGSRSGYMRREGVYRLDQRGQPIETGEQQSAGPLSAFAVENQNGGAHQTNSGSIMQQLVPLVLTLLCFICLIISGAFCYHRLATNWKQRSSRRHSIDGMRSICSGSNGGGPGSGSDESHLAGVKSTASLQNWSRSNGAPSSSRCFKERQLHSELVDDHSPSSINTTDSPPGEQGFHYCLRDQIGINQTSAGRDSSCASNSIEQHHHPFNYLNQEAMSATLNPKSTTFSQSVSMRDFNVIGPLGNTPAATLNMRSGRSMTNQQRIKMSAGAGVLANDFAKINATIARGGRLRTDTANGIPMTEAYGNVLESRICSNYGSSSGTCKQKQEHIYGRNNQLQLNVHYGTENPDTHLICGHQIGDPQESFQSQETSWTNPTTTVGNHQQQYFSGATNYAIPASFQHQIEPAINEQPSLPYSCDDVYGQGTIDACIQHLMNQQYQQEQKTAANQQAYTMITGTQRQSNDAGPKENETQEQGNIYGQEMGRNFSIQTAPVSTTESAAPNHVGNRQLLEQRQLGAGYTMAPTAHSVNESSSSSSGIGVDSLGNANHLDCASTITSATTTNLCALNSSNHRPYARLVTDGTTEQQHHTVTDMN